MSARGLAAAAALGSLGLLAAALAFQHLGGLAPCEMCLWQRWPHVAGAALGLLAFAGWVAAAAALGALAMLVNAGLGLYHTGVERKWWEGPGTCSGGQEAGLSPEQLLDQILAAPVVRCDEVAWEMLGLSMASWNGLASLALAGLWVVALRRRS